MTWPPQRGAVAVDVVENDIDGVAGVFGRPALRAALAKGESQRGKGVADVVELGGARCGRWRRRQGRGLPLGIESQGVAQLAKECATRGHDLGCVSK